MTRYGVLCGVFLLPLLAFAEGSLPAEPDTVIIEEVNVHPSVREYAEKSGRTTELNRVSNSLESQLAAAFSASRAFQLVDSGRRTAVGAETPEPDDTAAGTVSSDETAAPVEPVAKYRILPEIDGFDDRSTVTDHPAIGRSSLHREVFLSALVRVINAKTGRHLPDAPEIQLSRTEDIAHAKKGEAVASDRLLAALAREMAKKLAQEVASVLRPPKVLSVTGKQLLINRGSEAGFEQGDLVEILTVRNVKDDDTGEMYREETPVGQAIISRLDKKQSFATISGEDSGIIKGAVVRRLKSAAARRAEAEQQPPDPTLPDFGVSPSPDQSPGSSEKPLKWR